MNIYTLISSSFFFNNMKLDEFPSLDFLLPYTGNTLQVKLIFGALAGLCTGILLIVITSLLIIRIRRKKRQNGNVSSMQGSMLVDTTTASTAGNRNTTNGNGNEGVGGGVSNMGGIAGLNTLPVSGELNKGANINGVLSASTDSLDKNPDIIPQGKLFDHFSSYCKYIHWFLLICCCLEFNICQTCTIPLSLPISTLNAAWSNIQLLKY